MVWNPQTSLGGLSPYPTPRFHDLTLCRVASVSNFTRTRRIDVVTLDGAAPAPALCLGMGTTCPYESGHYVIIGFIDGEKDNPIVLGGVVGSSTPDILTWNPQAKTVTIAHPTGKSRIVMDNNGNIDLYPGGNGRVRIHNPD